MQHDTAYDRLPEVDGTDMRHAWGVFGPDDQLGTLNRLTPERRHRAAGLVRTGRTIGLTLPLDRPSPPLFGRRAPEHELLRLNGTAWDDRVTLDLQASTQWDGFLHVRHRELGFYGGHTDDPRAGGRLGVDQWAAQGIVGRGVLLDVAAHLAATGVAFDPRESHAVPPSVLQETADAQQVSLEPGDVVCIRFGWAPPVGGTIDGKTDTGWAGLAADADTARFLWDGQVAAVACDNPSVEVQPGSRSVGSLHHRLLTMLGIPLGELFDFSELAVACQEAQRYEFLFVSVPLNLSGAIASPGNALAML